jgi:hypothetical protein
MIRSVALVIASLLVIAPVVGLAQTKPKHSDSGMVEGFFGFRDEGCVARCASDSQCVEKCPLHRLTPEELREILRPANPASSDQH